ncbi:unnamed protein product [Dicrocoelium dendriticum]|nr:unnamed protein product [Dicrocoelium dendriticum]
MCNCTCRIVLFVINTAVGLAGFLLALFGALMAWGKAVMQEQLSDQIGPILQQIYEKQTADKVTNLADLMLKFTSPFGAAIFGFGLMVLVICLFGCCGACYNNALCLKIYTGFLVTMTLLGVGMLIFYYTDRTTVFALTEKLLRQALVQYVSVESSDVNSMLFNVMMPMLNCCGVSSGLDFDKANKFVRTWTMDGNDTIHLEFPVPCCKMNSRFEPINKTCPAVFNSDNSNYNVGCWDKLYPWMIRYGNFGAIFGIVVLLLQVVLIVMSILTLALKQI